MDYIEDPETGALHVRMADWPSLGFVPTAQAITEAEAREGIAYTGEPPARTAEERLQELQEVVDQMLLDQLMSQLMAGGMDGLDLEGLV